MRTLPDVQFMVQIFKEESKIDGSKISEAVSLSLSGAEASPATDTDSATHWEDEGEWPTGAGLVWTLPTTATESLPTDVRTMVGNAYQFEDNRSGGCFLTAHVTAFRAVDQKLCTIMKAAPIYLDYGRGHDSVARLRFEYQQLRAMPYETQMPDDLLDLTFVKAYLIDGGSGAWRFALHFFQTREFVGDNNQPHTGVAENPPDQDDEGMHQPLLRSHLPLVLRQLTWE